MFQLAVNCIIQHGYQWSMTLFGKQIKESPSKTQDQNNKSTRNRKVVSLKNGVK